MTPEEKAKMYEAIGYQESAADLTLPKEVSTEFLKVPLLDMCNVQNTNIECSIGSNCFCFTYLSTHSMCS